MINPEYIQSITHKIVSSLPPVFKTTNQEIHAHLQGLITECLLNMKLVTREEFDIQTKVLAKTRSKLDALEKKLEGLSSIIDE